LSLLRGDDPLLDDSGEPLDGYGIKIDVNWDSLHAQARKHLLEVVWDAAVAKNRSFVLSHGFDHWLMTTVRALGLDIRKRLTEKLRLSFIDPEEMPFFPKNRKLAAIWKSFAEEIKQEQFRIFQERIDDFQRKGVFLGEAQKDVELMICRREAVENLQQRKSKSALTRAA
jgi:hypothetical protein